MLTTEPLPRYTRPDDGSFAVYGQIRPDTFRMLLEDTPTHHVTLTLARDGSLILTRWLPVWQVWSVHVSVPDRTMCTIPGPTT